MIRIAKADGVSERELINQLKARSGEIDRKVTSAVTDILNNVKQNGANTRLNLTGICRRNLR